MGRSIRSKRLRRNKRELAKHYAPRQLAALQKLAESDQKRLKEVVESGDVEMVPLTSVRVSASMKTGADDEADTGALSKTKIHKVVKAKKMREIAKRKAKAKNKKKK